MIIIDTGVLYALFDRKDSRHSDSLAIGLRMALGEFGSPVVSDYVISETITLFYQRKIPRSVRELVAFLDESKFKISFATEEIFRDAIKLCARQEQDRHFLSLADSAQIIISRNLTINTIATFDSVLASFFEGCVGEDYALTLDSKEIGMLKKAQGFTLDHIEGKSRRSFPS